MESSSGDQSAKKKVVGVSEFETTYYESDLEWKKKKQKKEVQLEEGICIFCKSADAVWTAVPCGDRIVCTKCKNKMKGMNYKVRTECNSKIDDFVLFPQEKSDCPEMEKNYPPLGPKETVEKRRK